LRTLRTFTKTAVRFKFVSGWVPRLYWAMVDINVTELIDSRPLSRLQIRAILLCGLVALLDGLDSQSIGVASPAIAANLGLKAAAMGPVLSAALLGAAIGALSFGQLADRIGRKRTLIATTVVFAFFTFLTAVAESRGTLLIYRFAARLGLGGATPCFLALTAEYAPHRIRAALVSAMWAGYPLGGMLGGFINSYLIANWGWRSIFYLGGVTPLVVATALTLWLPESLGYLLARGKDLREAKRIVARLTSSATDADVRLTASDEKHDRVSVKYLFAGGRGLSTIFLWILFVTAFVTLAVAVIWTPTLLHEAGMPTQQTAFVIAFNGLGAFIGMVTAGRLMEKFGVQRTLAPSLFIGAACIAGLGYNAASVPMAAVLVGLIGLFVGIGGAGAIAISAMLYPTFVRSTGIGWGMGIGRFGQMLGPLATSAFLGWGWSAEKIMLAVAVAPAVGAAAVIILETLQRRQAKVS
jgi:MFS transporter, AAHS family, 4-hydroxybenzoate transporter